MGIPFTVYAPLLEHDEDAEPYANDHMAVVCDGLGGSGQNTYIYKGEKWSSAALGSRVVSRLFCNYFREKYYEIFSDHALTNEISSQIVKAFKISLKENMKECVKTNYMDQHGLSVCCFYRQPIIRFFNTQSTYLRTRQNYK